jgi:hypothetical protein
MAINVDISKITGINQVGNSYQRKSAVPLDYYSLFNTKAEAEAYAASNPVSYVGQVISYIHEGEVKVCVIANAAGLLKEVGTAPVGDGKTIEVSAEGAVALLGAASAANGTLPMIEEVDGKSKLVWKTLEQIGAGDGNDNTTYAFSFANQKITVTPSLNGVAQDAIEIDLAVFATEDEMAAAIKDAIDNLPADKDTTYTLSLSGMELTLTPSEGEAQKVTIDAYSKKEIDDKFAALPEDKDTTYSVKAGEKALKLAGTEFSTELGLSYANNRISLTGIDGAEIAGFDASAFVEDGVLQDVSYNAETRELTFTWNIVVSAEGEDVIYKTDVVNIADLVDTYAAGHGLDLSGNEFSIKLTSDSEEFLSVDANGLKLSGVQSAIDAAKDAAIEDAKKYAVASTVYTKEEVNDLLDDKANSADVYTKTEADNLLNNKANSADVYSKTEADNLLSAKANAADVYAKSETYTQKQVDDLLEGIQAGSSESAASVNTKLEALKKTLNNEIYGNDEGTGDSRIDTAETKLAGIAEGAQVNVIESVVVDNGSDETTHPHKLTAILSGKTVTLNDKALQLAIADAKLAGTNAAQVASEAASAASQNAAAIQGHDTKIGGLDTLTKEHTSKIAALELADSTHAAEFKALSSTVGQHGTDIAALKSGKADTTVTDALAGRITANENSLKTLNETTIPGINGEIAKKANIADVYNKTEIGVIAEGKTLVKMIEDAQSAASYDDTAIRGLITDNADAIAAIYKVEGETKTGVLVTEIARVEGLISKETGRAQGAESTLSGRLDTVEAFWKEAVRDESEKNVIDTLKEIQDYIETDESGASAMAASIKANSNAIAAIYNVAEDGTESGTLVTKITSVEDKIAAINHAETGILALAQAYTDDSIAALLVKDVDNKTIKLNEGKAYVAEVSTDLLVQGSAELHLVAGGASI